MRSLPCRASVAANALKSRLRRASQLPSEAAARLTHALGPAWMGERPAIRSGTGNGEVNDVESFWNRHTVDTMRVWTPGASKRQLEWRFNQYPLFREFSGLWGDHDGQVLLDYGCGPGNDLVGFALYTGATKIIGIDVSHKALGLAADRLALHRVDPARIELIHSTETDPRVPLQDASVDYLQSQGVLHHTSDPKPILRELLRVLKPGGEACVMVYNRDSLWRHLYVAYQRTILDGDYAGLSLDEAFSRTTDGEDCPIARSYGGEEFTAECELAGFETRYLGGYLSRLELDLFSEQGEAAVNDERLGAEHRDFIRSLSSDDDGYPLHGGMHAGIGGTYRLRRPAS